MNKRINNWWSLRPLKAKLPHDKTLVEWIGDILYDQNGMRVNAVDRHAGTIHVSSVSVPSVVHEITIRRVS